MKVCARCGVEKDLASFNKKGSGLQPCCRVCDRERSKEYYNTNKDRMKLMIAASKAVRTNRLKEMIRTAKSVPCVDCGITYPWYVMDFDHLSDKEFNVSQGYVKYSEQRIVDEIAKCEVVCSNCHRIRTYKRANNLP